MADTTDISDPRSKDLPWYIASPTEKLTPAFRELLENYSKVAPEEVESHVSKVRDQAWSVYPFPCIGNFSFLSLSFSRHTKYAALLNRFKTSPTPLRLLDVGCCFGQDLRKLAFDGAPAQGLFGCDLQADYEAAGHAMFMDEATWTDRFIAADVLASESALEKVKGTFDVVVNNLFLHVFSKEQGKIACRTLLELLRPEGHGEGWVLGSLVGTLNAHEKHVGLSKDSKHAKVVMRHSVESLEAMFQEQAEKVGRKIEVEASYAGRSETSKASFFKADDDRRILFFVKTV